MTLSREFLFRKLCCNFGGKASPSCLSEKAFLHSGLSSCTPARTTFQCSPKPLYTKILFAATTGTLRYLILFLLRFHSEGAHCFSLLLRRGRNEQAKKRHGREIKALFPLPRNFPFLGNSAHDHPFRRNSWDLKMPPREINYDAISLRRHSQYYNWRKLKEILNIVQALFPNAIVWD